MHVNSKITHCVDGYCRDISIMLTLITMLLLAVLTDKASSVGEVIWAVNCGGESHVDAYGIRYQKDSLKVGTASEHGRNMFIRRCNPADQILYQTERYHHSTFAYDVPIKSDGDFVLVLKFSEVWFNQPNQKVFDVRLNNQHVVVDGLDIYAVAGLGMAHDEIVPFSIRKGTLRVNDETSMFDGKLLIEFVKLRKDNPKVNAIYVMKGSINDVPQLPPLPTPTMQEEEDEEEQVQEENQSANRRRNIASAPKIEDPYAMEDISSMLIPIFVAVGAFVPLVFCLCKL